MHTELVIPLNKNIRKLKPSATLAINELSTAIESTGKKVYRLGFGQSPFPVPEEVTAALKQNAHKKEYLPVKGLLTLREAVAAFYQKNYSLECTYEDVLIGPGSKELIYNLQIVLDADLLLPSPSWVSYEPQADLAHKKAYWLPTKREEDYLLSAAVLDDFCNKNPERSKILLLNYPNNPVGNTYSIEKLKDIAKIAQKHKILIVADEIYGEVHHQGAHQSIAQFYPKGTIISSGLSKWCGAGGWRLGTFLIPENCRYILESMAVMASETFTSVSTPIQYAAITAFEGSKDIDQYLINSRKILSAVGNYVYQELSAFEIKMAAPTGGFYLFTDFEKYTDVFKRKNIHTSEDMCASLLSEVGVALLPGSAFGRSPKEYTARLSFVDFDGKKLLEDLDNNENTRINANLIIQKCPNIIEATKRIKHWLRH